MTDRTSAPLTGQAGARPAHPVSEALRAIESALDSAAAGPHGLTTDEKADALVRLSRLGERVASLRLRLLVASDDVAEREGARSAAHWLAHRTQQRPGRLRFEQRLGHRLHEHPRVADALASGELSLGHAQAVVESLDELADPGLHDGAAVGRDVLDQAEQVLVGHCADFTPIEVRRLGRHVLAVVAPDLADAHDQRALEAEERRARERTHLRLTPLGDGTTRIAGLIPDLTADILTAALNALTNPRRPDPASASDRDAGEPDDNRPIAPSARVRRGHAFCTLVEHLPTDGLPTHGGSPVSLTVTMQLDDLRDRLSAVTLDTGTPVSAGQARRLACEHRLIPAVLDGRSQPLDLGRAQRYFQPWQVRAHALRRRRCQARGCDIPVAWCEKHHRTPWSTGGRTDLAELAFLCSHHHHRVHDSAYRGTWSADGEVTFERRPRGASREADDEHTSVASGATP